MQECVECITVIYDNLLGLLKKTQPTVYKLTLNTENILHHIF